jgi:UrcA family protein
MYTKTTALRARCALGAAAVACALIAGNVAADSGTVTVAIPVSTDGLNASRAADAQKLYERIEYAAYVACTRGNRVGLAPSPDPKGCSEKALANAVRSANLPLLTQAYLAAHSVREAMAQGIKMPGEIAAK